MIGSASAIISSSDLRFLIYPLIAIFSTASEILSRDVVGAAKAITNASAQFFTSTPFA
jgi:hypothetical protein